MKKLLTFALAATTLFAACSKDVVEEVDPGPVTKTATSLGLEIKFPDMNQTRAADDDNATADETKVTSVAVFIFNPNGTPALGSGTELTIPANFEEQGDNTWSLKSADRIKTTSGPKKIYVAANLPSGFAAGVTQENILTQTATNFGINGELLIANVTGPNGIAMISAAKEVTLVAMEDADDAGESTPDANKVSLDIERMVAKVAVSHASATTSYTVSDITYTVDRFGVGQDGAKMYPVKWITGDKLVTPYGSRMSAPDASRMAAVNAYSSTGKPKDLTGYFYAGENATQNGLRGEAAYASVRARMAPAKYWKVEDDALAEDSGAATADAYVVSHNNKIYFTKSQAVAIEVCGALNAANPELPLASYKMYSGHYCHYFVFLNRKDEATEKGHLELHRNDFINVLVNGVKGIGEPGNPDDGGETPGPGPEEPEIPVVSIPTMLEVTIDVTPWNYTAPTVILE